MGALLRTDGDPAQLQSCTLTMDRSRYQAQVQIESRLGSAEDYALTLGLITRKGAERVIRYAFELARAKGKHKVTSVDKVNVLPHIYGLWREVFAEVSRDYPEIETAYNFVDAATMWFVKNPEDYGVVVAPNLFGDIITDLGAEITGALAEEYDARFRNPEPFNPKVSLRVQGGIEKPPFDKDLPGNRALQRLALAVGEELGVSMHPGVVRGGSDGNFTAATGCPTLDGMGVTGGHVHQLGEFIYLDHLPFRLAFAAEMTLRVLEQA